MVAPSRGGTMRQPLAAIAIALGTLASWPALGVELRDSVFQVTFHYAEEDRALNDTSVPLLPGNACYYWYAQVGSADAPKSATETLTLPVALADWGDLASDPNDGIDVSADGTILTRTFTPEIDSEGWFSHGWCVVEGDPTGAHKIEIAIEGEPLTSYDFQVVLPEDFAWPSVNQPIPRERSVDNSW